ncbi:hypothetical protein Cantr_07269 [Candida viswanathii]|uniref:Uncharacterized protein n=1 Tax=Candida viswanathii TaxID=5486 RepID=A0A367Y0R9_9ASCO|nr:hypothetical protein Cantr_07269 [Candida viswanathii]
MYLVEPIESSWINYQSSLAGPSLVSYESYVSEANSQSQILPIDESSLAATEYTTSWEVVNSDGSVTTQSGMVNQSGDSLTTFTTFPPQQAEQGISSTAYTTTFTTTNSEGK